jgi:hypothetical protein
VHAVALGQTARLLEAHPGHSRHHQLFARMLVLMKFMDPIINVWMALESSGFFYLLKSMLADKSPGTG